MREFVLAIRAIWDTLGDRRAAGLRGRVLLAHAHGAVLQPGPNPHGNPQIMLAAVGPLMTETAGEVADGSSSTASRPRAICARRRCRRSSAASRRPGAPARVSRSPRPAFVVAADTEEEIAGGDRDDQAADRLLRLDPGLPPGARAPRLGRAAGRAAGDDQARRVGPDVGADRRRARRRLRRGRHPRGGGRRDQAPLRRHRHPDHASSSPSSTTRQRWRSCSTSCAPRGVPELGFPRPRPRADRVDGGDLLLLVEVRPVAGHRRLRPRRRPLHRVLRAHRAMGVGAASPPRPARAAGRLAHRRRSTRSATSGTRASSPTATPTRSTSSSTAAAPPRRSDSATGG